MNTPTVKVRIPLSRFGGSRLDGQSGVTLWSDDVVLATAWSDTTPGIAGDVFTTRGTIAKGRPFSRLDGRWVVRDTNGVYLFDTATRKEAVQRVLALTNLKAFRALNEAQAALNAAVAR